VRGGCGCDRFERNRFLLGVLQRVDAKRIVMAAWMCAWCCKTHCNGCMNVAWELCWGGNAIVFCSWDVLQWLHQGCDSDLSVDFINLGAGDFLFFGKSASKSSFFRFGAEIQFWSCNFCCHSVQESFCA